MSFVSNFLAEKFRDVRLYEDNLHGYQKEAFDFLYKNPFSALFLDTGLGKTATLLKLIRELILNDECKNVLVIGPARVVNVTWPDEIRDWQFSAWMTSTIIRDEELVNSINEVGKTARREAKLMGLTEKTLDAYVEQARLKEGKVQVRNMMFEKAASIFLIHKEQVEFLVDSFGRDWPFDVVIVDESSSLKDHKTNRWKALWKIRPLVKRFHMLTATPTAEGWRFIWPQITLLDRGERLGKSYPNFLDKYFTQNKYTRKFTMREGAEDDITKLISDICLVMKQEDYLDLQQPVVRQHKIHLSAKQMEKYEQMEREFVVELDDGTAIEADSAGSLNQKLLQMASGVIYQTVLDEIDVDIFKKRRVVHELHDDKINYLKTLEEELNGESMLVAYYHNSSLERILKAFPHAKAMDKQGKLIKEWNQGKIKMLLMHPQSDAHGLNLQRGGRHVVFFDIPWSYENYYQFYRRLARQGQTLLVVIHLLIAHNTIDEVVVEGLQNKRDSQDMFFSLVTYMRNKFKRRKSKSIVIDDDEL